MEYQEWKLTDQERAELNAKGGDIARAQEAKEKAYIEAGGIILNPDALSDLYEELKEVRVTLNILRLNIVEHIRRVDEVLAKAEELDK